MEGRQKSEKIMIFSVETPFFVRFGGKTIKIENA